MEDSIPLNPSTVICRRYTIKKSLKKDLRKDNAPGKHGKKNLRVGQKMEKGVESQGVKEKFSLRERTDPDSV